MEIKLLVEGGAMKPGPALSQQLGPAGINIGQVISKVNDATSSFNGLKVPVILTVNTKTKEFDIQVASPPVSELIKKQIKIEKGSGLQKKMYSGNASIEDIISVAKTKFPNLLCKDLKSAVSTVAGTCSSLGMLIENKIAKETVIDINDGKYDKEIKSENTETSSEKRKKLDEYFSEVHSAQEKQKKVEEAAAAAAEAEKTTTTVAPTTAEATPSIETKPVEAPAPTKK